MQRREHDAVAPAGADHNRLFEPFGQQRQAVEQPGGGVGEVGLGPWVACRGPQPTKGQAVVRVSRLIALTTARSDAVTIDSCSPTPHTTWASSPSPTSAST